MATASPERARRGNGWLRKLEPELALRLPLEPPNIEAATSIDVGLDLDNSEFIRSFLVVEPLDRTASEIKVVDGGGYAPRLQIEGGGSVALDAVDARRASRPVTATQKRRSSAVRRGHRAAARVPELSLAERLLLVLQPPLEALLEPQGLLEWHSPLYPYQYDGVRALIDSEALLLADDMGLGKTIQAIAALRILIHLRRAQRALVVAPASLLTQWRRELELWAPELRATIIRGSRYERARLWRSRAHVLVVSYETLRQDVVEGRDQGPSAVEWDVVALDEAQKIKNPSTRAAQSCKSLYRRRAWALTGTPLENDFDDLASIVQFLTPFGLGDGQPPLLWADDLLAAHRELQLRRRKVDVLEDLPPKSVNDLWLQLAPGQRSTYDRAEEEGVVELRGMGEKITIANVLALIQRLKQVCNVCPTTGESAKLEDLSERLEQIAAEDQRALVFSQYVHSDYGVGVIAKRLDGLAPLAYHGSLSATEKDQVIERFKQSNRHKVLALSLRAGGQGLNLQEASYVFHFDRWWNPAVERQAEDRTHRLGQKNAVTVYRYICENTIEERIDQILRKKQALFDEYVDQVSIDPGKLLGEKEIFGLFGLEPPKRGRAPSTEEKLEE